MYQLGFVNILIIHFGVFLLRLRVLVLVTILDYCKLYKEEHLHKFAGESGKDIGSIGKWSTCCAFHLPWFKESIWQVSLQTVDYQNEDVRDHWKDSQVC